MKATDLNRAVPVTIRDIAERYGHRHGTVASWRQRWADWPEPVGRELSRGAAGQGMLLYNEAEVAACMHRHRRLGVDDDRWPMERIAAEYGLSLDLVSALRRVGGIPAPDGHRAGRPWWWPDTVRGWAGRNQLPSGAWVTGQVTAFTGLSIEHCIAGGLAPDGTTRAIRWWWPDSARSWWTHVQGRRAAAHDNRKNDGLTNLAPAVDLEGLSRLSLLDISAVVGLSYNTLKVYRGRGLLPPPDGRIGNHAGAGRPWWTRDTIMKWNETRRRGWRSP